MVDSLAGLRVVVSRPARQAAGRMARFADAGAEVVSLPMIEIKPANDLAPLAQAAAVLAGYQWVVFVSPSAVDQAMPVLLAASNWPDRTQAAVVGKGSAAAFRRWVAIDPLCPTDGQDSEALLRQPLLQQMHGQRVLILRGNGGRELLADTLRARGAEVDVVCAYQRVRPDVDPAPLLERRLTALIVTSGQVLDNLLALVGESGRLSLQSNPLLHIFAIHPRIADHARQLGFSQVRVAGPDDQALLLELVEWFAHEKASMNKLPVPEDAPARPVAAEPVPPVAGEPMSRQADPAWRQPAVWLAALALLASGAHWLQTRQQMAALQLEAGTFNRDSRQLADRNQELARQLQTRLAVLESKVNESHSQQLALQAMYQELSRDSDDTSLADVEQALELADQQLQLAGNVRTALIALQNLDQRLQGSGKPHWIAIRRAVAADAEALKKAPFVDTVGISVQIDNLVSQVDKLPLVVEKPQPRQPVVSQGGDSPPGWLAQMAGDIWREIKQLIRVRRLERQEPLLLSPEQSFFLRENLKLRLLDARIANIQRDGTTFKVDLRAAQDYLERYFDSSAPATARFTEALKQLQQTEIAVQMPTLARSLAAVQDARLARERIQP